MAYSSAYFSRPAASRWHDAQRAKLDLICRKLGLRAGQRLLDVGCGWGSLILYAAEHYGVQATGVTLSGAAARLRRKRIADRGLDRPRRGAAAGLPRIRRAGRAVRRGRSIEMGEHVGEEQLPDLRRRSCTRAASPAAGCCCSRCRGTRTRRPAAARSSRPTSRRTCTCGRCRRDPASSRGRRASRCATSRRCASTTCAPSSTGSTPSSRTGTSSSRCVGEEVARVWRLYLVGGALAFEEGRMGVDQILACGRRRGADAGDPAVAWPASVGRVAAARDARCRRRGSRRPVLVACWFAWSPVAGKHSVIDIDLGSAVRRGRGRRRSSRPAGTATPAPLAAARAARAVGLRLAMHIGRRTLGKPEDPRYEAAARQGARGNRGPLRAAHDLPAAGPAGAGIASPILVGGFEPRPARRRSPGSASRLWLVGVFFEAVGDAQLARVPAPTRRTRARSSTSGCGATPGTRTTSATPCVWWGIFLVAADAWPGVVTIYAPIIMTLLLTKGSGRAHPREAHEQARRAGPTTPRGPACSSRGRRGAARFSSSRRRGGTRGGRPRAGRRGPARTAGAACRPCPARSGGRSRRR